jgi:hypothetical protein
MKTLLVLTFALLGGFTIGCATGRQGLQRRPINLRHAFHRLDRVMTEEERERLRSGEVTPTDLHHGFGAALRANWGLWGRSALATWFRVRGIHHADDMSAIILTSYVHRLRGEPIELRAQIRQHKEYWRDAQEFHVADVRESVNRAGRIAQARSGWVSELEAVPAVVIPALSGPRYIRKIERYRTGFVLFTADRETDPGCWHSGALVFEGVAAKLRPVGREGCAAVHDLVTVAGRSWWLCRSGEQWQLLDDREDVAADLGIAPTQLRFATNGDTLALWGDGTLWEQKPGPAGGQWKRVFRHEEAGAASRESTTKLPSLWDLIGRGDTPRRVRERLYFPYLDYGNSAQIAIVDLRYPNAAPTTFWKEWARPHFGPWSTSEYGASPAADGTLWVTVSVGSHANQASLFGLRSGDYEMPIVQGSVDRAVSFNEELIVIASLSPGEYRHQIPATATWTERDDLYLAGPEGIALASDGYVTPIVRFQIPAAELAAGRDPIYLEQFVPHRLGRFDDGSFLLTSPYQGVVVVDLSDRTRPVVRDPGSQVESTRIFRAP